MAEPITFHTAAYDPRAALRTRLQHAPEDHADAILAAYDVLQELHDRGILDIVRSGLAAGGELLEKAVDGADTPGAVRAVRNLLLWQTVLGRIEPEWLQGVVQAIPDGLAKVTAQRDEQVSLWRVLRRTVSRDSLRGFTAALDFLQSVGRHLALLEASAQKNRPPNNK